MASFEGAAIMMFERDTIHFDEVRPGVVFRDDGGLIVGRLGALMRHLEGEKKHELLDVIAVREAVIAEDVAVVPEFADEGAGCGAHDSLTSAQVNRGFALFANSPIATALRRISAAATFHRFRKIERNRHPP